MQLVGGNGGNQFRQYAGHNARNLNGYNAAQNVRNQVAQNPRVQNDGIQNQNGNGNLVVVCAEGNAAGHNGNQISIQAKLLNTNQQQLANFIKPKEQADCSTGYEYGSRQTNANDWRECWESGCSKPKSSECCWAKWKPDKEEAGIQLQAKEYDLMAAVADLDEIKEVNANCILMANLPQASSSGTQTDSAPVYDSDGSAKYTELLEPIPEPQQVPQNDNNAISEVTAVEQDGETVEQHSANFEETRGLYESLY
nr:hypothetical protein [Tanacetum cinerariifolium]